MRVLFVHQNFPGQYLYLLRRLAEDPKNDVTFISHKNANQLANVRKIEYAPIRASTSNMYADAAEFEAAAIRARSVLGVAAELANVGYRPDIIIGHNGWGEVLHLHDVWPNAPIVPYFEFYYHERGLDVDFDPEFPVGPNVRPTIRLRNAVNLLGLSVAAIGQTPTRFQHETYPDWTRGRLRVVPEGADLALCCPDPAAEFGLPGSAYRWRRPGRSRAQSNRLLVTFVARNLEPYRGFHILMRALPRVLAERPDVDAVLVGGDEVSYGVLPPEGGGWRERMLKEVGDRLPAGRVLFPGKLSYPDYLRLLQTSSVHVYFTYPFVASWSLREALACGCAVVASDTSSVREFITHDENGWLSPFHDPDALADTLLRLLADRDERQRLSEGARRYAEARLDLSIHFEAFDSLIADALAIAGTRT